MNTQSRTQLARILRQMNQGLLSSHDAYHAVCALCLARDLFINDYYLADSGHVFRRR